MRQTIFNLLTLIAESDSEKRQIGDRPDEKLKKASMPIKLTDSKAKSAEKQKRGEALKVSACVSCLSSKI